MSFREELSYPNCVVSPRRSISFHSRTLASNTKLVLTLSGSVIAVRCREPSTVMVVVRAGVPGSVCYLPDGPERGATRAATGMRIGARRHPKGAVVVVGCAPTALVEALAADWEPAVIVGLPVGFVGAAESKALARSSRHLTITNVGEKGGSAVAAGAANALRRLADAR